MKRIMLVVIMFVLVAAFANAEAYTVKKGDCLSRIAQKYGISCQRLFNANQDKIKNPDRIYPGWVLQIPEKGVIATSVAKPFLWKKAGINPFGNRDFAKAINMFKLPEEVKQAFIVAEKNGEGEDCQMAVGQRFEQQICGNYKIINNVIVQLPKRHLGAKIFTKYNFGGYSYFLIKPLVCTNWSWWREVEKVEVVSPKPVETETATIVEKETESFVFVGTPTEEVEIPSEVSTETVKPIEVATISEEAIVQFPGVATKTEVELGTVSEKEPFVEETEEPVIVLATETFASVGTSVLQALMAKQKMELDCDITNGVFAEKFRDGNNVAGDWAVGTLFFPQSESKDFNFGLMTEYNSWGGKTGDGYEYLGRRLTVGPAFRWINLDSQTIIRVGYGKRNDSGKKVELSGIYESEQTTHIVSAYFSNEKWEERKWFAKDRLSFSGDFDVFNSRRDDYWIDANGKWTVRTPPENQSMVVAGWDSEIFSFDDKKNVVIGGGLSGIYYYRNANLGIRPEIGLYLWNRAVEVKANYTDWCKGANSYGGGVTVNFSNLLKKLEKKEAGDVDAFDVSKEVKNSDVDRSEDVLKILEGD